MTEHWSDCAVNSEPAFPAGPCDCGGYVELSLFSPAQWALIERLVVLHAKPPTGGEDGRLGYRTALDIQRQELRRLATEERRDG